MGEFLHLGNCIVTVLVCVCSIIYHAIKRGLHGKEKPLLNHESKSIQILPREKSKTMLLSLETSHLLFAM